MKKYEYEIMSTGEKILANSGDEFGIEYEKSHGKGAYPDGAIKLTDLATGEESMMYPVIF